MSCKPSCQSWLKSIRSTQIQSHAQRPSESQVTQKVLFGVAFSPISYCCRLLINYLVRIVLTDRQENWWGNPASFFSSSQTWASPWIILITLIDMVVSKWLSYVLQTHLFFVFIFSSYKVTSIDVTSYMQKRHPIATPSTELSPTPKPS
jgi:hypothetical protein